MSPTDSSSRPQTGSWLAGAMGRYLALSALSMLMLIPFVWMVLTSLKSVSEVDAEHWIPSAPQWQNYREVFNVIEFGRFYWNSIFVASWVTFLQVLTSSLAAYGFARLQWKGRDAVFLLYLGTMMLPGIVMIVPNYSIMIRLGLVDTLPGLILPAAFTAFGTFLLRQFMLGIPRSLDEAAEIDGANHWQIFWNVILPLTRPGIVTLTIFSFIGNYNSFFWPLIMVRTMERYTLPIGLLYFDSSRGQSTHLLMAAVTMAVLPMIVAFIFLQKQLIRGIQLGGVKG
ncbi:MAG: carbohydrate ABC transporter permease [Verrucomicrobiota bacterium JB022]|nr:carbohydrate ABC transporter permease [Verrucomicrobiota bacterium JB022]